jgi:hypothetical protein
MGLDLSVPPDSSLLIPATRAFNFIYDFAVAMKFTGFLLLLTGWVLVLAAIVLLPRQGARAAFMLAGIGVELLGLVLVTRTSMQEHEEAQ